MADDLPQRLRDQLERLAPAAERYLVAVSGGSDSVALLRLCLEADIAVEAAHFDHGLREGSAEDAEFVRELSARLGVRHHAGSAPVRSVSERRGWNLADAARRLRYAFLARTARERGLDAVLVGHTRDDQAETVLQQLLRGTAYASGMPPVRGHVLRPLLDLPRERLRDYLQGLGQEYLEDPSNEDLSRMRPWLRHVALAQLEERRPGAAAALARHARIQHDVASFVREEALRRFGESSLSTSLLVRAPAALQRQAIADLLRRHDAPADFDLVERVRAHLDRDGPYRIDVGLGRSLRVAYGRIDVTPGVAAPVEPRPVARAADLPPGAPPALLDTGRELVVRSRAPGDTIRLEAGTKKVADLLIDRKVPREARDALAVVADGSDVLWIEGVATAAGVPREPDVEAQAMDRALRLAARAAGAGELPVGAVVLVDGAVVAEAHNETEAAVDATAHAEVLALRRAAVETGRARLPNATLVVTMEPCPMCFGAMLQAHVSRVAFGAPNLRDGALGGVADLRHAGWKRSVEVRAGVRESECAALLRGFFERLR